MQAVVVAGGLGTRLRPLTYTRPKPLIPLLNRAMILHVIDRLPRDIDEVVLPVNYKVDSIRQFFQENDVGKTVKIVKETTPLGTGGAVKNVESELHGRFVVFNGDVVSSINVSHMVESHQESGGIATIALWEVKDPSAFGAVNMGERNKITRFIEKPGKGEAPSNLINAGVYVFEQQVLSHIPRGRPVSMEREVFPKLIRHGLAGYKFDGYWADAGTRSNYLRATKMLLASRGTSISRSARIGERATVQKPVNIGPRCIVDGKFGPNVSIGSDCVIGDARVFDSVLLDAVTVHKDAAVQHSIVGEGCKIGPRASITSCIVGDGVTIRADQVFRTGE